MTNITSVAYKSAIISSNINCTGNISLSGITNVTGNISASGSISGGTLTTPNTFTVTDGANSGIIDQISTELTLSSSGNRVAIASGNTLEFKNDDTSQYTAYTAREIIDDCALFTFMWNSQNPSTLRYALTSTFSINQQVPTTLSLSTNRIYAYPVRLTKGQVANGAGFYLSVSGSPSIIYALYNTSNPGSLLAVTAANTPTTGMNLVAFTSSYTVPTTGIYYICINASSVGTSLSTIAIASNTYMSYGITTMTNGVLNKAAQTCISTGFPTTLNGLAMTLSTQVSYAIVYSLTASV
jgi:hypothetical protein